MNWHLAGLFFGEALVFLFATINIRACAKGWVKATLSTDAIIAGLNFSLVVWIAEAGGFIEQISYVLGGVCGSAVGMYLTKHWKENETPNN